MASPRNARAARELKDDLLRYLAFIQDSLDNSLAVDIGHAVTGEMLSLILKGISPIEGNGRFPAYKWAAFRNELKKQKGSVTKALRQNKKAMFRFRRQNTRQLLLAVKEQNRQSTSLVNTKYPFTPFALKQGKKPRPVNLLLTGQFLADLEYVVTQTGQGVGLEIGFFNATQADKEQGHREGANGQPERPIIPVLREDFAQSIQKVIYEKIEEAIDRAAALG